MTNVRNVTKNDTNVDDEEDWLDEQSKIISSKIC